MLVCIQTLKCRLNQQVTTWSCRTISVVGVKRNEIARILVAQFHRYIQHVAANPRVTHAVSGSRQTGYSYYC